MDLEEQAEDRILNEEYKIWKKNAPFLYDLAMTHSLEWPTLTVEWSNSNVRNLKGLSVIAQKLILGTHTSSGDQNYLMIAEVLLPYSSLSEKRGEETGYGGTLNKIEIKQKICHDGEVHRARSMPQNESIVATKSPFSTVCVFDTTKHSNVPPDNISRPQHRCHGHSADGYALSWNPQSKGQLLSGSDDANICIWDLTEAGIDVEPLQMRKGHTSVVEDVAWSNHLSHMFGSVGDDSQLLLWDSREGKNTPIQTRKDAHVGDINCLSFNPNCEFTLATGGSDRTVAVWDTRNLKTKVHSLEGHQNGVYQVSWAPFDANVVASSGSDRRLFVWDVSRVGTPQSAVDARDGPPELLFVHGGHTAKISDFSWSARDEWTVASVAEDNILQVWKMADSIRNEQREKKPLSEEDENSGGRRDQKESRKRNKIA